MKTYLVTGAAGFIGANYIKYILAKHEDIKVVILDALTYAGNLGTISKDVDNERCFLSEAIYATANLPTACLPNINSIISSTLQPKVM